MRNSNKIKYLITVILAFVPLIIIPYSIDMFYYPKLFIIFLIVSIIIAIHFLAKNSSKIYLDKYIKVLILYGFFLIISIVFSIKPINSLWGKFRREEGVFALMAYILLFIFSRIYYKHNEKHKRLIFFSALIVAGYGIFQYLGYDPIPRDEIRMFWKGRAFSTMGNPNFLGSYLVLMLPLPIFKYLNKGKEFSLVVASVIYLCLLVTFTRSALLGLFVIIVSLLIYSINKRDVWNQLFIVLIVFIFLAIGVNVQSNGKLLSRFSSIGKDARNVIEKEENYESAGASRIFIWVRTIELVKERPLVGYGLETLHIIFDEKYHDDLVKKYNRVPFVDKAHNEYLHIAVSSGIPSLMAYLIFIFFCLRKGFKLVKIDTRYIPYFTAVSAYLVQAFFNISVVSVAYIYWIFLGIITNEDFFHDELNEIPS